MKVTDRWGKIYTDVIKVEFANFSSLENNDYRVELTFVNGILTDEGQQALELSVNDVVEISQ